MDVPPEITEVVRHEHGFLAANTDKDDEEDDLCRICRSPEEPGNPLRYPCLCRGSIKYVHQDCLHLWLNHRGYRQCEICGINYSFLPVYSENAPHRLPCHEFLMGVLVRASPYMKIIFPWILAFLLNTYFYFVHPWFRETTAAFQADFGISSKSAYLLSVLIYNALFVYLMHTFTLVRRFREELIVNRFPHGVHDAEILIENGLVSRAAHVLWKYKKILCDWYHSQLHNFLGDPPRLVGVALHEFGAIGQLLFFLDDNAFTVLNVSISVTFFFVILPFSIGWIVLATVGGGDLCENSPVILGNIISIAYLGIFFTLRLNSFPAIVMWFSLGFHFISEKFSCLLYKNLFAVVKSAFVLGLKFGVLPLMIGCWLDICTLSMFGTTLSNRIEILTELPFLMYIHWIMGFFCVMIAFNSMDLIQEIIHKRRFWFLLDITDPDYKITNLDLGQTLFAFASHGVLLVILLHLPIKAITLISPTFFPLEFWAYDESFMLVPVHAYIFIMQVGVFWFDSVIRPAITPIVHKWIITVSSWLQLSRFLLQEHDFQNVRQLLRLVRQLDENDSWLMVNAVAEGSVVSLYGSQFSENDIDDQRDNRVMLRIAMLLILAALTLFLVSTTFMALPFLLGRAFFYYFSFVMRRFRLKNDDLYAFWIGSYILRAIYVSICFIFDHIWTGRTNLLLKYVLIWIRNGLFFSIWISVIPGLLGLLIDLMIIIPSRVPVDETPIYFLIQDWLIGVVVLHIWTFLTMLTHINCFATKAWRVKFKKIRNVGINRLPLMWLLRDVIGCIISTLLTTLCIPYLLLKSLFPLLGYSHSANPAIERLIWPVLLALIAIWFMAKQTYDLVIYLHQLVFNDRYVVGERVDDLTEDKEQGLIHGV